MSNVGERPAWTLGEALRVAPLLPAAINAAVVLATWKLPTAGGLVRAQHLLLTTGELFALALVASAVVDAWARWLPDRRRARTVALFAGGFAAAHLLFSQDMVQLGDLAALGVDFAFAVGLSLVPLVHIACRRWRIARVLVLAVAIAAAITSHFVLKIYYPGAHFTLALASLLGTALVIAGPPRRLRLPKPVSIGFAVLTSLLAAASLALPPNGTVALEMARDESAPLYRFIAPLRSARHAASLAAVDADALPWFAPRTEQPEVPPTAERPAPPPDLVLVLTIDAFRYDVWTGQGNGTLFRNLKQLARQSVEVENAHSVGSLTVPSVSSMLSGLYFSQRYWSRTPFLKGYRTFLTRDTSPGLCDLLRERGVIAATVPATDGLKPEFGVVRGCETIGPDFTGNRTSADMMPMLLEWIDGISLEKPAFVYAHFLDGHHPYDLAGKDGTPLERQRRELALVDAQIGVLVGELKRAKLWERTAIVITADHGESFGEHGATNHGANIHEELTRVPMIIRVPGARPRVVKEPASGIDVTPTVLDILGLPTPGTVMGQSLLPLVFGQDVKLTRPIVFDSSKQQRGMLFRDGIKVIHRGLESSFELYDLNTDPGELTNLVDTHPDAENRIGALVAFFDAHTLRKFGYRIPTR